MKKLFILVLTICALLLASCELQIYEEKAGSDTEDGHVIEVDPETDRDYSFDERGSGYYYPSIPSGIIEGGIAPGGKSESYYSGIYDFDSDEVASNGYGNYQSRQLSAKALFDNLKYDDFLKLLEKSYDEEQKEVYGEFYNYQQKFNLSLNRIELHIENGPLAYVELLDNEEVVFSTKADRNGLVYLFNDKLEDDYTIRVNGNVYQNVKNGDTIILEEKTNTLNNIQLMFVIDTTGSMGDEINYLKVEIKDVIERITNDNNSEVTLALLFYRDQGDDYVTRYFDFTTDIDMQVENLGNQSANGGGDFEEAVQTAMIEASLKQWSTGNNTKIIVHVADAPSHDKDVKEWFSAVNMCADKGIRLIEVASSGIDKKTEFLFRSQAIITNGCYAYLTNHSGIGGNHIEASTEEDLPVEFLNDLLVRVINGMHTGTYEEPIPYEKPGELTAEIKDKLCEAYCNYLNQNMQANFQKEDIIVLEYVGQYNNSYVALMTANGLDYCEVLSEDDIEGIKIQYINSNTLKVFNDGNVYNLKEAYELKLLSLEDIQDIANKFNKKTIEIPPVICEDDKSDSE